jgi:cyclase
VVKTRLIPVVLLRGGVVVQSKGFRRYQPLGNPSRIVERLAAWASDELVYLDITPPGGGGYDCGRDDLAEHGRAELLEILGDISRRCFMPLSFGGGIRTLADIERRVRLGADKCVLNSAALADPSFIDEAAREFGSQCIVVCVDARRSEPSRWRVMTDGGRRETPWLAEEWVSEAQSRGAGEILVQSVDQDGTGRGYDLDLLRAVRSRMSVPLVALGGVGEWAHLADGIAAGADAVAAANIFNYSENSVYHAKDFLFAQGLNVRRPTLASPVLVGPTARCNEMAA